MASEEVSERASIQEELSNMTFEEMLKLKERLGGKAYNEAVFGIKSTKTNFKRENKNRPRETSSKIRPSHHDTVHSKKVTHDPRFNPLCGDFNEKVFNSNYSFVSDMKKKELEQLKKQLSNEDDEQEKERIQYLITRMENQEREARRHEAKREKLKKEHETQIEMLRHGEKPRFQKKSEKRVLDLVEQFESFKKKGKLHKHIEKQRRKNARRDWNKLKTVE